MASALYLRFKMHRYFIKTPWWVKKIFPSYIWKMPAAGKEVFLTFDDGPHPVLTPWVLNELKKHEAQATFFCIGKNVIAHPQVYKKIVAEGHAVGNHTQHHVNGWKTPTEKYVQDVKAASEVFHTNLFRPPYGRIKRSQAKALADAMNRNTFKIIMWDVLSADFDTTISVAQCVANVLRNVSAGSIIVFHDSEKAAKNLQAVLPVVLKNLAKDGYKFSKIVM